MSDKTILVAEDDQAIRTVLSQALKRSGYSVRVTESISELWQWVQQGLGDLVVTDVVLPDGNGLEILPQIKLLRPELNVVVMSAQNTLLTAVKANEGGAFEYLPKPFDLQVLLKTVEKAFSNKGNSQEAISEIAPSVTVDERSPLIGRSQAMQEIYRLIARLTSTDLTVLITGESGTGKELVARALHNYSHRKKAAFVAVNMAAIPKDLIESELFGHEKGAFTGAIKSNPGRFEQAKGGTLFLDEIGDMPLEAQTRLLRVLQGGEYSAVGSQKSQHSDVRIISATHHDLGGLVANGRFREDLYYRLNVVPISLPPLRERTEDIPDLVQHFLIKSGDQLSAQKTFSFEAFNRLKEHDWPGNVRELENTVLRLSVLTIEDIIDAEGVGGEINCSKVVSTASRDHIAHGTDSTLSSSIRYHLQSYFDTHGEQLPASGLYNRVLHELERPLIELCLAATKGNQIKTAELLGLNRNTLRKKIKELEIEVLRRN